MWQQPPVFTKAQLKRMVLRPFKCTHCDYVCQGHDDYLRHDGAEHLPARDGKKAYKRERTRYAALKASQA